MRIKSRRKAREAALQGLYRVEIGGEPLEDALRDACEALELSPELRSFAQTLGQGVQTHREAIDGQLAALLQSYDFARLAAIDRNMMRLAAYELIHLPAIPPAVTINEAIEICKRYSTAESGRFVNGVLGKLLEATPKAQWDPATAPAEVEIEEPSSEVAEEVEEQVIEAGSDEEKELGKVGAWKIRIETEESR